MDAERPGFSLDAADGALLAAMANEAANPGGSSQNFAAAANATPSNLTAPSSLVLGATLFTPRKGEYILLATLAYTLSAAGTVTVVAQFVPAATASAGGAVVGQWRVENGGTAVSITGGSPTALGSYAQTLVASELSAVFNLHIPLASSVGTQIGVQLLVTSAANLSSMTFNGTVFEP